MKTRRWVVVVGAVSVIACGGPTAPDPPGAWGAPVLLGDAGQFPPRTSCLAAAADGSALVIWESPGPWMSTVWANRVSADDRAQVAERIQGSDALPFVEEIRCALDGAGYGFVTWVEWSDAESRLMLRRIVPGGWDGLAAELDRSPSRFRASRITHDLAVAGDGRALVAWGSFARGIRSALFVEGRWQDPGSLAEGPFVGSDPTVRVQLRGAHGVAVYVRQVAGGRDPGDHLPAAFARFLDGSGRWGAAAELVAAKAVHLVKPSLDARGDALVGTVRLPAAGLWVTRSRSQAWLATELLPYNWDGIELAGAPDGEVLALMTRGGTVSAARWLPGAAETVLEAVSPGGGDPGDLAATVGPSGAAYAVWRDAGRTWLARSERIGAWDVEAVPGSRPPSGPCAEGQAPAGARLPQVAFDETGAALVAWVDRGCTGGSVRFQRRGSDRAR